MTMARETIEKLIDAAGVSIISSVDEDGFPNTKAMLPPRRREGLSAFYFTTNTSSMRVKHYRADDRGGISVASCSWGAWRYSPTGRAVR